jgi:hypothetical protein
MALDGCRSIFFHSITNQKHAGVTEGGWDRPHDRARTFGERDGNDEGDKDDDDEYGEDGDIPDDDDEYTGSHQMTKKTQQLTKLTRARRGRDKI